MSVRAEILQGIRSALQRVQGVREVQLIFEPAGELRTSATPLILIYPSAERSAPTQPIGYEVWDWDVVVEVWDRWRKGDIEKYIAEITKLMYTSTIHTAIMSVKRLSIDYLYPEGDLYGARLTFMVRYFHLRSQP